MQHIVLFNFVCSVSLIVTLACSRSPDAGGQPPDDQKRAAQDQKVDQELSARFAAYVARRTAAQTARSSGATETPATVESQLKEWAVRTAAQDKQALQAGTVFTPEAADLVRNRVRVAMQSDQGTAARAELEEAAAEHLPAEGYETIAIGRALSAPELPFSLAEVLPRPPHGLEYRFSNDRLLLRDESTSVLVDYVTDVLPPTLRKHEGASAPPESPAASAPLRADVLLPNKSTSVKFAVLGDTGAGRDRSTLFDGKYRAHAVAILLEGIHSTFAFPLALMVGDNMYTDPDTTAKFFEEVVEPYKVLRTKGIIFRAVLGNHDNADFQLPLAELNLNNRRFYAFELGNVRFLMLHSDEYIRHDEDPDQDAFIKHTLSTPFTGWTVAAFHHPLFSSGTHRNQNAKTREAYKALLAGGVRVVFTGHEHFYERTKEVRDLVHFVSGAAAKLREGDLDPSEDTELGFDDEHSAMLLEIDRDEMYFQAIGLSGRVRDCGVLPRRSGDSLSPEAAAWAKKCRSRIEA